MKDINSATPAELKEVPHISGNLATIITNWRDRHGPLGDMRELTEIPGVGERTMQRLSERFTVGSGTEPDDDEKENDETPEPEAGEPEAA